MIKINEGELLIVRCSVFMIMFWVSYPFNVLHSDVKGLNSIYTLLMIHTVLCTAHSFLLSVKKKLNYLLRCIHIVGLSANANFLEDCNTSETEPKVSGEMQIFASECKMFWGECNFVCI